MKRYILCTLLTAASILWTTGASARVPQKDSLVNMPWKTSMTEADRTGSVEVVGQADLEHYPVADIQGRLVGVMDNVFVTQVSGTINPPGQYGSPAFSTSRFSVQNRYFSNISCVVDDVLVPVDQFCFEPDQIESITLIKDIADKSLYGPAAANGLFYIRTKQGGYNTPFRSTLDVESGIAFAGLWPEWMDGYEYACMNNEARRASGYDPLYSDEALQGIKHGNAQDLMYPNVDYKDLMMADYKPVSRFGYRAHGGNDKVKFNFTLNGLNDNDIIKIGPANDYYKLNATSSITAKIGKWIEANASFYGLLSFRRYNSGTSFTSYRSVPGTAFPLLLQVEEGSPFYNPDIMGGNQSIYAISRLYQSNPYAAALESGASVARYRSGMFNSTINVDLGWVLPGLKSSTMLNAGTFTNVTTGKNEDYIAYYWNPLDIIEAVTDHIGKKESSKSVISNYAYQTLNIHEKISYDRARNGNKLSAQAIFFLNSSANASNSAYERMMGGVANVRYNYQDRYVVNAVANYSGIGRYYTSSRFGFFPAVSAAWNASNEAFLKDNKVFTRLKLFAQVGTNGDNDIYGKNYLWQGDYQYSSGIKYGPYVANSWFGNITESSSYTYIKRLANHELTWPVCKEFDMGFESTLFGCLDLSYEYYNNRVTGIITEVAGLYSQSLGYANSSLYQNYDETRYYGHELSMRFFKDWDDYGFSIGGSVMNWNTVDEKVADDFTIYDYQKKTGRHSGDYIALHCLGKFQSQEEINSSALYVANTKVGDLKYEDRNNDGAIDSNDSYKVGDTNPLLRYTLNMNFRYRKFDMTVVGQGCAFTDMPLTNAYFWNGWGDGVYSQFVKDDMYPGLSYVESVNNFIESDYWLVKGGYFKIRNVELAYTASFRKLDWLKSMRVSLRGTNLLTLTSVPYVDPESPSSGVSDNPLFRTVTLGVKFSF